MSLEINNSAIASNRAASLAKGVDFKVSPMGNAPVSDKNTPKVVAPKPVQLSINIEAERIQLKEAVALLNQQANSNLAGLGFVMDEKLGRPIVTVRNTVSGEVIRQIPNEVVVRVARQMDLAKGLLHNESV